MPESPLWIYKCNTRHRGQLATGDWDEFFAGKQPGEWGGSTTMASSGSLEILWNRCSGETSCCAGKRTGGWL
jgi:hypothetical protein